MIRINLLPHREERRQRLRQQMAVLAGAAVVLGLAIVGAVYTGIEQRIEQQQARNNYLDDQIKILDKQIADIKTLKQQIQALLARKDVVEKLQTNRSVVVHVMDQLVRVLPDGVFLTAVSQNGPNVALRGYAQSGARVSTLMRSLDASPWLGNPQLIEIKAAVLGKTRWNEFALTVPITPPQPPPAAAAAGDAKPKG